MIYNITYTTILNWLLPPRKRQAKYKAWFKALLSPLQWLNDLFADDYVNGQIYPSFNPLSIYYPGTRITFTDNRNYERIYQDPNLPASGQAPDAYPQYWMVIQDNFIGAKKRTRFNGQIIMLENELNEWFRTTAGSLIYLGINSPAPIFWMSNGAPTTNYLSNQSSNSQAYMANVAVANTNDFTVYVPVSLSNTWTTETADVAPAISSNREKKVRIFVNKYKLSGITYNVVTY